jgi:hypothetical protein
VIDLRLKVGFEARSSLPKYGTARCQRMRNPLPAIALSLLLALLAGCAAGGSVTLDQSSASHAMEDEVGKATCPGKADLAYTIAGTGGDVQIVVTDATTGTILDTGRHGGGDGNTVHGILGGSDTWTVTVHQHDFSGAFRVVLTC